MLGNLKTSAKSELSCYEQYRSMMDIIGLCAKICGANVADSDFQITWVTYTVLILIFNFFCCTFYTIYEGITNDGDITVVLQTCCFFGAGSQATVKLLCFLINKEKIHDMKCFLDNTFMIYENRGDRYRDALSKGIVNTKIFFKILKIINVTMVIGCCAVPIIYYAIYKEKILIMQFLLPGLNQNTNTGYFLLCVMHFVSLTLGVFGTFAADMYLLIFVGNIPLYKDILRCKFDDFNDLMDRMVAPSNTEIHSSIVEIVVWHQDYLRLLDTANSTFFIIIFAYVVSCAMGIMSSLYCMLAGAWPAAPFLLAYSYLSLYAYCGLGTLVDNANKECSDLIYAQCPWYELPVREQRYILFMLRVSQTSSSLTVGQMLPLNVSTGLQLTKALFSVVMLLLSTDD